MRALKIALCSPGLDRATAGSVTCGLDFLASLIRDRHPVEFFTVAPKDVMRLSRSNLIGRLDAMPAPWIKRVNDPRERVEKLYRTLTQEFPGLRVPVPAYPGDLHDAPDRYAVPVYRCGKN